MSSEIYRMCRLTDAAQALFRARTLDTSRALMKTRSGFCFCRISDSTEYCGEPPKTQSSGISAALKRGGAT